MSLDKRAVTYPSHDSDCIIGEEARILVFFIYYTIKYFLLIITRVGRLKYTETYTYIYTEINTETYTHTQRQSIGTSGGHRSSRHTNTDIQTYTDRQASIHRQTHTCIHRQQHKQIL